MRELNLNDRRGATSGIFKAGASTGVIVEVELCDESRECIEERGDCAGPVNG